MTLGLQPSEALANDICAPLINFYQHLARGLEQPPWAQDEQTYYAVRADFNDRLALGPIGETATQAQRFYYLNRVGFRGLCRFNAKGRFNVPYGSDVMPPLGDFRSVLHDVAFSCTDFKNISLRPTDFVYADPPYDAGFVAYTPGGFTWADQERVALWLAAHPGPVVASNLATARIVRLYRDLGFVTKAINGRRSISVGHHSPAREVLILNAEAAAYDA